MDQHQQAIFEGAANAIQETLDGQESLDGTGIMLVTRFNYRGPVRIDPE